MKKLAVTVLVFAISLASFSSTGNYNEEMKSNLKVLEQKDNSLDYSLLAKKFQDIANNNKDKYEALYYAAFCNILYSFNIKNDKERDELLSVSENQINSAMELSQNNIELIILKAFMYQAMLKVKPAKRGNEYSQKAQALLNKANKIDETNPRVYFLTGQNIYYRPKVFGGGKEKAISYYEKAEKLFNEAKRTNVLQPIWGKDLNNKMLKKCN